ncbi:hypothetical protein [Limnohabitans sp.]|uniref:hypothetical protein n=1 Tax=Limnohabitans sp. TaxID=1907725 RepID=UPI00286F7777|nr:hypothetical protein [Limnohabitans sp.]
MTYCVGVKLKAGLDKSALSAKMIVYEKPGDRFMVLLSAGNLSISQSVREILQVEQLKDTPESEPITIWNAESMFDAVRVLGATIRRVLDMVVYEAGKFECDKVVCIDEHNSYCQVTHNTWGVKLCEMFDGIDNPVWNGEATATPLLQPAQRVQAQKKIQTPDEKLI